MNDAVTHILLSNYYLEHKIGLKEGTPMFDGQIRRHFRRAYAFASRNLDNYDMVCRAYKPRP